MKKEGFSLVIYSFNLIKTVNYKPYFYLYVKGN